MPRIAIVPAIVPAIVLAIVLVSCAPAATPGAPGSAVVRKVIDGDTIEVRVGGRTERVRLLGIDTPESVGDRPHECFGKEASAFTASLLPPGSPVRLVRDAEARDAYGRLLAYVYREDDLVNLALVQGGYADTLSIAPNLAHADELHAAVVAARRAKVGLWGTCGGPDVTLAGQGPSRAATR